MTVALPELPIINSRVSRLSRKESFLEVYRLVKLEELQTMIANKKAYLPKVKEFLK
jgi:hypothetical protein